MKQFLKKYAMTLVALVIASGSYTLMSFKMSDKSTLSTEKWFEFKDVLDDGDINNPANYLITPGGGVNPPSCLDGDEETCAVHAQLQTGSTTQPDLETVIDIKMRATE